MLNESGFNEYFISCTSIDKIYLSSNHFFYFLYRQGVPNGSIKYLMKLH